MKNDILLKYRMLNAEEVNREIFKDFIRYQNVTKCWRKENGKWIIKDAPFVDDWIENDYEKLYRGCGRGRMQKVTYREEYQ